jgi:hypothetical protein
VINDPTEPGYYWANETDEMGEPQQIVAVIRNRLTDGLYVQKIGFETTFSVMDFTNWRKAL